MATVATNCIVHDRKCISKFHRAVNHLRRAKEFDVNTLQRLPKQCCSCLGENGLSSLDLDSLRAVCRRIALPPSLPVLTARKHTTKHLEKQPDTVFIQNLPRNVTRDDLQTMFSQIGMIKIDTKTKLPKIVIYKDKNTGEGNGEATITYEDEEAAQAIINWYDNKEFLCNIIKISLATRPFRPFGRPIRFRGRGGARGAFFGSFRGNRSKPY